MKKKSLELRPVLPVDKDTYKQASSLLRSGTGQVATVFCSDRIVADPRYEEAAVDFGRQLGEAGHNLVWGGSPMGVMLSMSEAARGAGSKLVGVVPSSDKKEFRHNADIMLGVTTLEQRKRVMIGLGDVAVALPGGLGSLGEIATTLEMIKSGYEIPPLVLMNTNGFYNALHGQLEQMDNQGFLDYPVDSLVQLANSPAEAVALVGYLGAR